MITLGIETSCDDTSLALYSGDRGVLANRTASQLVHDRYGGVVPEIASRQHMRNLLPVFSDVMSRSGVTKRDIEGIGVTSGPGLVGSLLVGVGFAKALAFALERPLIGVHHIEAHILSNELDGEMLATPAVALVVSGGHTCLYHIDVVGRYKLVGSTRDDAAGECFDKVAKLLGLGFPGGPAIERAAARGRPDAVGFPRAMMEPGNFDFSFSGLKTAVRLHVDGLEGLDDAVVADIAASVQEAIIEVLVAKTVAYAREHHVDHVYLAGGVAANRRLRAQLADRCRQENLSYHAPLLDYCTDNGAMIALAAHHHLASGRGDALGLDVFARGPVPSWA